MKKSIFYKKIILDNENYYLKDGLIYDKKLKLVGVFEIIDNETHYYLHYCVN